MAETQLFILCLSLLLAINLLTIATQTVLSQTTISRLSSRYDQSQVMPGRTIRLLQSIPVLRVGFSLSLMVLRFMIASLVVFYVLSHSPTMPVFVLFGWLFLAALSLFWLEWLVRKFVAGNLDAWAIRLTFWGRFLRFITMPVVAVTIRIFGSDPILRGGLDTVTTDEMKNMVDAGQQEGLLEQGERQMIYSIFDMGETLAREIMVPRIDILAFDVNTTIHEAVKELLKSGHSRVPVYEDTIDNVLGLLYAKDLLSIWQEGEKKATLRELVRPVHFIPEAKKIDVLLAEMQQQRIHMAIVVDEYGGVAGMVTFEDIVEEILGEIQDEYDQAEEMPYQQVAEGEYIFQGKVDLDDFNDVLNSHLSKDDADTLGGFIYNHVGRVPAAGEHVQVGNLLLTVEQVLGRRIRKVRAQWLPPEVPDKEEKTNDDG